MTARVLSPGDRFADYAIVRLLGAGGFGTVYEAEHLLTGRRAAVKIAHPHVTEDEDARARALQEARALGELQHANVVALHHAGITEQGQVWIAMELLSGWTLRELLQRPLPLEQATAILSETCEGVAAAHDIAIIHRDLKPENVFVTTQMAIKVLDFTAAKAAGRGVVRSTGETGGSRKVLGTPAYMSPEQLRGERVDSRTDLYSLGVMAYEVLAGRHPFVNADGRLPDEFELARRHDSQEPAPLSAVAPHLPASLEKLVRGLLAKRREERPARAKEVAAELRAIRARYLSEHGPRAFEKEWRGAGSFATSGRAVVAGGEEAPARLPSRRIVVSEGGANTGGLSGTPSRAPAAGHRVIHITARRDPKGAARGARRAVPWAVGGAAVLLLLMACVWLWVSRGTGQEPPANAGAVSR